MTDVPDDVKALAESYAEQMADALLGDGPPMIDVLAQAIMAARRPYVEAIEALLADPHGCAFCDYGKLRTPDNPDKGHDDDCPYLMANAALTASPPGESDLARAVEAVEEALEELVDTLTPAERGPVRDPVYGDEVRALGLRIGFGALMSAADYEWRAWLEEMGHPPGGEFVAGPCRSVLQHDMRDARAALTSLKTAKEPHK